MFARFPNNPLIKPADVNPSRSDFEVMCAFNAGATQFRDKTILLVRVAERPIPVKGYVSTAFLDAEHPGALRVMRVKLGDPELDASDPRVFIYKKKPYLTSISHLRLAESRDGRAFTVAPQPAMVPELAYEEFGIEDPRITFIDGAYYINYSAIWTHGITTCLARTTDFVRYEKLGIMFGPHNKDVAVFPERIRGRYYCFHRPSSPQFGAPSMWMASGTNLRDWGDHRLVIAPRPGAWDAERVGCGALPIRTPKGWLEIYHGADHKIRYCSGAVLLDLDEPWRVIARSRTTVFAPEAPYETQGFMPNVVFCNGLVERPGGRVDLYYGAADETVCGGTLDVAAVLDFLKSA